MRMPAHPSLPRLACVAVLAAVLPAPAAGAGEVSLTLDGGWYALVNASNSAKAVFDGDSGGPTIGFAGQFGLGESFFIRAGARYFQRDGERVFVSAPDSPVFRLGHPLTVRIIPAYGLIGYRFLQGASLRPYIAVGGGATSYDEESDVAGEIFESNATKAAGHAVAGLVLRPRHDPVRRRNHVLRGAQRHRLRRCRKIYGEDDIGGLSAVLRISFVR